MLKGVRSKNHPQQVMSRGPDTDADDRALPRDAFRELHKEFKFTIDVAASPENAKLGRFYTRENSGLEASWSDERVYCNPPYSDIAPWCKKAWDETSAELIVLLLPANRTEQSWWQRHIEPFRDRAMSPLTTRFLSGRQRFLKPGQKKVGPNERPPFGLVLCIWER